MPTSPSTRSSSSASPPRSARSGSGASREVSPLRTWRRSAAGCRRAPLLTRTRRSDFVDAFLLSTAVIFVAELGDKSQLMAMTFAARYRARDVLIGITVATLLVHLVSVG